MALAADLEVESVGPTEMLAILAGAVDILYKGAILMIETDGYIEVPTGAALTVNLGICKKRVNALGSHAEWVEVEMGRFWLAHAGAAQTDVGTLVWCTADDTLAHVAQNVTDVALGLCVGFKTGYLLVDTRIKGVS
jgi:hypothetical protein